MKHYIHRVELLRDEVPDFGIYPFCLDAVRELTALELHPKVSFFVGENGSGKSTLLEAIAVAWGFNAEGGSRNVHFDTRRSHSPLYEYLRLSRGVSRPRDGYFLRAESFFNVATHIEQLDEEWAPEPKVIEAYGGRSLHEQSHGESFMALLLQRFSGRSLFILDEPEAALSPTRQMALLSRMHQLVREGSQFVIATHSPLVMAYPQATIFALGEEGIRQIDYEETEHFQITRRFLNDPQHMLRDLLDS